LAAGGIIGSLHTEAKKSNKTDDDDKTQHYVDALVNLSVKGNSKEGGNDSMPIPRRIVYLKDFGSIARVAQLLLSFILRAIQKRDETVEGSSGIEGYPSSTILVFGFASGIKLISGKDDESDTNDSNSKFRARWHEALRAGGQALGRILPKPDDQFPTMSQGGLSCSRLCPLSAQFFLQHAYSSSELRNHSLHRDTIFEDDEPICRDFIFAIIPKNAHSEESTALRRIAIKERTRDVNEALLRLSVGERGGLMDGKLTETVFESNDKRYAAISSCHLDISMSYPLQPGTLRIVDTVAPCC
jgi:hypothetical protein